MAYKDRQRHTGSTMPLFEIILQKPDAPDELRFTDYELRLDEPLVIDGNHWAITSVEAADHPLAVHRYVCRRAHGPRPPRAATEARRQPKR